MHTHDDDTKKSHRNHPQAHDHKADHGANDHASICKCDHSATNGVCNCNHGHAAATAGSKQGNTLKITPYAPLIITFLAVIIFAASVTLLSGYLQWHFFMQYFMAGYFLAFGVMQAASLRKSAKMLQQYDPLAKKAPIYGYLYPFIQIFLGVAYLLWISPIIINALAVVVLIINFSGILDVVETRRTVRCGCLGTAMKVQVGWVTLIEVGAMLLMAAGMLIYFIATINPDTTTNGNSNQHHHRSL